MPDEKNVVSIDSLTREAKTYDNVLRTLPYFSLQSFCADLKLNLIQVDKEHIIINKRRRANVTGPYRKGAEIKYTEEIGSFYESSLKPELTVARIKDNITGYSEKNVLSNAGEPVDLKSKKHPLERMILDSIVTSHAEDIVFSAFFAERDTSVFSPMTAFNGFFTKLDVAMTEGVISIGAGNLYNTGEFVAPTSESDSEAYEKLVDFVGSGHNLLRSSNGGIPQLILSQSVLKAARAALRNKTKYFDLPTIAQLLDQVREDAMCPGLIFSTSEALGFGSKLILQKVGTMDIGMNTGSSNQFVQVRDIFEDANEVQFWLESAYDTRIRDIHQKVFMTNEMVNTPLNLAGDYGNLGAATVTISPEEAIQSGGMWKLQNGSFWKRSGMSAINLPEGQHTIVYRNAAGFTSPDTTSITIEAGKEAKATGTYIKK